MVSIYDLSGPASFNSMTFTQTATKRAVMNSYLWNKAKLAHSGRAYHSMRERERERERYLATPGLGSS
jgi:hypothetical protein